LIGVEAGGLHFDSYRIEVAILVNESIVSWLIKPEESWTYWSSEAENMHGISREKLMEEGSSVSSVATQLNALFEDSHAIVYSDAVHWDTDWIDTLFHAAKQKREFHLASLFDLLGDDAESFKEYKNSLLDTGKYNLHRAE